MTLRRDLPDPRAVELASRLPEEPRWVDTKGLLLSGRCDLFEAGAETPEGLPRLAARSWDYGFVGVAGDPGRETLLAASDDPRDELELLVQEEDAAAVAAVLPDWSPRQIVIHRYPGAVAPEPGASDRPDAAAEAESAEIHLLTREAALDLSHLPSALGEEIGSALERRRPLAAALVDGRAVSFCYAPLETASLWDVAVETLPEHRRRGHAAACFRLLQRVQALERLPVWGALADNHASLGLARRLGFVPEARLVSFERP